MPTPYTGPTSRQFSPEFGFTALDGANDAQPMSQTFVTEEPHVTYIIQQGDTIDSVARRLYGDNTPATRARVRRNGFYVGSIHHVPRPSHWED